MVTGRGLWSRVTVGLGGNAGPLAAPTAFRFKWSDRSTAVFQACVEAEHREREEAARQVEARELLDRLGGQR